MDAETGGIMDYDLTRNTAAFELHSLWLKNDVSAMQEMLYSQALLELPMVAAKGATIVSGTIGTMLRMVRRGYQWLRGAQSTNRTTLYHYTNQKGLEGIISSQQLNASTSETNPNDVRYGNGQYLSDIVPGTKTPAQLSRAFLNVPWQGRRYTNYVEIDVTGLNVKQGRSGVFVIPNNGPLDVSNRIVSLGKVQVP